MVNIIIKILTAMNNALPINVRIYTSIITSFNLLISHVNSY